MPLKAYPIADMRTGEVTARKPWLLGKDAFELLENCHLSQGVLEKKKGFAPIGFNEGDTQIHQMQSADSKTGDTLAHAPRLDAITDFTAVSNVEVSGDVTSSYLAGVVVTIAGSTSNDGSYTVASSTYSVDTTTIVLNEETIITETEAGTIMVAGVAAVMGLLNLNLSDTVTLLALSTSKANRYDPGLAPPTFIDLTRLRLDFDATGQNWSGFAAGNTIKHAASSTTAQVEKIVIRNGVAMGSGAVGTLLLKNNGTYSGSGFVNGEQIIDNVSSEILGNAVGTDTERAFTGTDRNFFQGTSWNDILYFTNGNVSDGIWQFDGTHYWERWIDLDTPGGPDNDVTGAQFIFVFKGRLMILNTAERGSTYRQRARWSETNLPGTWKADKYLDAPTDHTIRNAGFIDRDLVVWFDRSIWKLIYTADPILPFVWERIDDERGLIAPYSLISRGIEQYGLGRSRILQTDGRFVKTADAKKPNFVKERLAPGLESYSYGMYFDDLQQCHITYVDNNDLGDPGTPDAVNDGKPQHILVYNLEEGNFATYNHNVHVLGTTHATRDVRLDDIAGKLDDIDYSFDTSEPAGSRQLLIFGNRNGEIMEFNVGDDHDGDVFSFQARTGRWNPFLEANKQAHCGKIKILVERHDAARFNLDHYIDTDNVALQTWSDIACSGTDLEQETVWITINVNATGNWHRFRFYNNAANSRPRFHAIVPFFRPAGNIA